MCIRDSYENVEVSVVAGVSAMLSGGALVGAPLGHDFAVIDVYKRQRLVYGKHLKN